MKAVHAVAGLFFSLALHALVIGAFWLFSSEKLEEEQPDPGLLTLALAEPPEAIEEDSPEPEQPAEILQEPEPIQETRVEAEPEPVIEEEVLAEAVLEEHTPPGDAAEELAEADAPGAIDETIAEAANGGEIEDILGGADAEPERAVVAEGTTQAGGEFAAPKIVLSFAAPSDLFQAASRHNMHLFGVDSLSRGVVQIGRDGRSIADHRGPIRVSGAWSSVPLDIEFTGSRDLRSHYGSSWNPRVRRVIAVVPSSLARQIGSVQEQQLSSLGLEPEAVETIHMVVSPDPAQPVRVVRVIKR